MPSTMNWMNFGRCDARAPCSPLRTGSSRRSFRSSTEPRSPSRPTGANNSRSPTRRSRRPRPTGFRSPMRRARAGHVTLHIPGDRHIRRMRRGARVTGARHRDRGSKRRLVGPRRRQPGNPGWQVGGDPVVDGVRYYLAHFDSIEPDLAVGQTVVLGQALGTMGESGRTSACHLHFSISPPCPGQEWSVRAVSCGPTRISTPGAQANSSAPWQRSNGG